MLYTEGSVNFNGDARNNRLRGLMGALRCARDTQELREIDDAYFSGEAMQWLVRNNYRVVFLNGQTIEQTIESGLVIGQDWQENVSKVIKQSSRRTQVAIHAGNPFLPYSGDKDYYEQLKRLDIYNQYLCGQTTGIRAAVGTVADYVELNYLIRKEYNIQLFGRDNSFRLARSSTILPDGSNVIVGCDSDVYGLCVDSLDMDKTKYDVHIATILVPTSL